jgi:hypothetical protein
MPFAAIARSTLPASCSKPNSGLWTPTIVSPALR